MGLLLALGLLSVVAAQARPPEILVSPSKAPRGGDATVYGFDFCPTTSCDPVSILVDDDLVLDDVKVNDEGAFQAKFNVGQALGKHTAKATQKTNDGQTLEDTYEFEVIAGTLPPITNAPTPSGGTTPRPGETGGATSSPSGSPGEDGGETPGGGEGSPGASAEPDGSPSASTDEGGASADEPPDDGAPFLLWALGATATIAAVVAGFLLIRRRRK